MSRPVDFCGTASVVPAAGKHHALHKDLFAMEIAVLGGELSSLKMVLEVLTFNSFCSRALTKIAPPTMWFAFEGRCPLMSVNHFSGGMLLSPFHFNMYFLFLHYDVFRHIGFSQVHT